MGRGNAARAAYRQSSDLPRLGDTPQIVVEIIPSSEAAGRDQRPRHAAARARRRQCDLRRRGQAHALAAVRSYGGGMTRPADHPVHADPKIGVLLINLGTPDAPGSARGPPLPRRIPQRPAGHRNPGDRVEADPARDHPAHPADEVGRGL